MHSSSFSEDPIFEMGQFSMFGDPSDDKGPLIFYAGKHQYMLVDPGEILASNNLKFRIACYLYYHATSRDDLPVLYVIGNPSRGAQITEHFANQIIQIVSIGEIDDWFPKGFLQIEEKVMTRLISSNMYYGQVRSFDDEDKNYLFFTPRHLDAAVQNSNIEFICDYLFRKGLLVKVRSYDNRVDFCISQEAVAKFEEDAKGLRGGFAFLAIKFEKKSEETISAIREALMRCGYETVCMKDYETNDWIMPEIFHAIKSCDFLVADFSIPCDGVYYEAGYALALGKPVIHTCGKRAEKNLHFDVAQKSTVMYESMDDLRNRLEKRVLATVGRHDPSVK